MTTLRLLCPSSNNLRDVIRPFLIKRRRATFARPWLGGIISQAPQIERRRWSNVMILLPSVLRPHRFPFVLPLAALAVTTVFLTVATGALAQGRYRTPDEAVAALADAVRTDALQQLMRVVGPGSDEIVLSGDPVDDAAMRRRFLADFEAKYEIVPDGED